MNREQLVEKAAKAICDADSGDWPFCNGVAAHRADAAAALDAVLPQITTIEELEPLPELTKVIGRNGGAYEYSPYSSPHQWFGANDDDWANSDLLANYGPLTVVWQPS